jgi:hypothetical protein
MRVDFDHSSRRYDAARQSLTGLINEFAKANEVIAAAAKTAGETGKSLADARQQRTAKQELADAVRLATEKTADAATRLREQNELTKAVELLRQRAEQLVGELESAEKAVADRTPAATAAAEKLTAARGTAGEILDRVAAARKMVAETWNELDTLQEKLRVERVAAQSAELQLTSARTLAEVGGVLAEAANEPTASESEAAGVALRRAAEDGVKRLVLAPLEPLTAEQIAWSILTVTGVVDQQRAAAQAEIDKSMPPSVGNTPPDPAAAAQRERRIEKFVYDKLSGNVRTFVNLFGHAGGQPQREFFATADQALFFANGDMLQSWLNPNGDNLVGRLTKLNDASAVADELYLSILIRRPREQETAAVTQYLEGRSADRTAALQEMAWALITSNEFRFQ